MLLKPFAKETIWGGDRLKNEFNKDFSVERLGETWECSVHPNGSSIVADGEFKGKTLREVLLMHPEFMGTKVLKGEELPILIKLIDAKQDLSIQVHPNDEYAARVEQQKGKTEMWYIIDALPGSKLVHGFTHSMSKDMVVDSLNKGRLVGNLQLVEVKPDDVFFTPAGTIHGIGAGCLIAEIQENSDVTYRVYDYDRIDKNGKKRELHLEKALEVLNYGLGSSLKQKQRLVHYYPGGRREILCRCKYFETEKFTVLKEMFFEVGVNSFQVLLVLDGSSELKCDCCGTVLALRKGDCVFLPASIGRCFVIGECEFLKIRV